MHKIFQLIGCLPNKALHLTAFPLRSKSAGELGRYVFEKENSCKNAQ